MYFLFSINLLGNRVDPDTNKTIQYKYMHVHSLLFINLFLCLQFMRLELPR